jgi:hydroxyethylthiazole kinase
MRAPHREHSAMTIELLGRLRDRRPRVHCITNAVAQAFTANVLLAVGAIPSMTLSPDEIRPFVASADALLVNLGTFDAERRAAVAAAIEVVTANGRPWVLDPVFVERSPPRAAYARALLAALPRARPRAIRLNAPELAALSDDDIGGFARATGATIGLTGARDIVTDGARQAAIANGHPLMARVTAMGCAASAVTAAFIAVEPDAFVATTAALTVFGVAGELAGAGARGPGSFAAEMIDALHGLDADILTARARIQ